MAYANGRIPTSALTPIPAKYHTHGTTAYLRDDAAQAFLRVAAAFERDLGRRLVAMSFYRPLSDQIRIFLKNYYKVSRPRQLQTDRSFNGSTYAKRIGMAPVASPGYSNHGMGITVDFNAGVERAGTREHQWMQKNGPAYGWDWTEGRRVNEPWHWSYNPALDRHKGKKPVSTTDPKIKRAQELLAALGYNPGPADGRLGDRTRAATKQAQTDLGITADGIPGPTTLTTLEDTMAKIDDLDKKITSLGKKIDGITRTLQPGIAGKRHDGELARFIRTQTRGVTKKDVQAATKSAVTAALAKNPGADAKAIEKAVTDGVQGALDSLRVTVEKDQ